MSFSPVVENIEDFDVDQFLLTLNTNPSTTTNSNNNPLSLSNENEGNMNYLTMQNQQQYRAPMFDNSMMHSSYLNGQPSTLSNQTPMFNQTIESCFQSILSSNNNIPNNIPNNTLNMSGENLALILQFMQQQQQCYNPNNATISNNNITDPYDNVMPKENAISNTQIVQNDFACNINDSVLGSMGNEVTALFPDIYPILSTNDEEDNNHPHNNIHWDCNNPSSPTSLTDLEASISQPMTDIAKESTPTLNNVSPNRQAILNTNEMKAVVLNEHQQEQKRQEQEPNLLQQLELQAKQLLLQNSPSLVSSCSEDGPSIDNAFSKTLKTNPQENNKKRKKNIANDSTNITSAVDTKKKRKKQPVDNQVSGFMIQNTTNITGVGLNSPSLSTTTKVSTNSSNSSSGGKRKARNMCWLQSICPQIPTDQLILPPVVGNGGKKPLKFHTVQFQQ
ncbi:hypothetical protein ABK040_009533 [Willaertia magna]